jgi:hypothetical protein
MFGQSEDCQVRMQCSHHQNQPFDQDKNGTGKLLELPGRKKMLEKRPERGQKELSHGAILPLVKLVSKPQHQTLSVLIMRTAYILSSYLNQTFSIKLKMSDLCVMPAKASMLLIPKASTVDQQFKICIVTNNSNISFVAVK